MSGGPEVYHVNVILGLVQQLPERSAEPLLGHLGVDDTAGTVLVRPGHWRLRLGRGWENRPVNVGLLGVQQSGEEVAGDQLLLHPTERL